MSDEEKPLDLRDKLAMEILNGLISHSKGDAGDLIPDIAHYVNYTCEDKDAQNKIRHGAAKRLERVIRACYQAADIIRKVRLSSFE